MKKRSHKATPLNPSAAAFNTRHAAEYTDTSEQSFKRSRVTGELCGKPAPEFKKAGRKVFYLRVVLDKWLADLPGYKNNAQAIRIQRGAMNSRI